MTLSLQKSVTPLLCLALLASVAGCASSLDGIMAEAGRRFSPGPVIDPPGSHRTGKNHYEPVIIASHGGLIRIKYLSVGPNAEHEQVAELISEYCDGPYTEINRTELRGYTTVDAECAQDSGEIIE